MCIHLHKLYHLLPVHKPAGAVQMVRHRAERQHGYVQFIGKRTIDGKEYKIIPERVEKEHPANGFLVNVMNFTFDNFAFHKQFLSAKICITNA